MKTGLRLLAAATALLVGTAQAQTAPAGAATVEAPVLLRAVDAGTLIDARDLGAKAVSPAQARGALTVAAIVGKEAVRRLEPGRPLRPYDVIEPQLVRKGQAVSIVLAKGALTIAATGRALGNGAKGEMVRVQNLGSQTVVEGEVVAGGVVRVALSRPDANALSMLR